jgi:hypothetical protein
LRFDFNLVFCFSCDDIPQALDPCVEQALPLDDLVEGTDVGFGKNGQQVDSRRKGFDEEQVRGSEVFGELEKSDDKGRR